MFRGEGKKGKNRSENMKNYAFVQIAQKKAAFQPKFLDAVFLVFTDLFYIYKYKESTCSH